MSSDVSEPPVLHVVAGGEPSDEETAALTAVLAVVSAAAATPDGQPAARSRWRDGSRPTGPWARAGWLADGRRSAQRTQQ